MLIAQPQFLRLPHSRPTKRLWLRPTPHSKNGEEESMDWSSIEQNWTQFRRNIKQKWVKLSDEDLAEINGRRELLEKTIQARYGFASDYVHKEIDDWLRWQHPQPKESGASKNVLV
jgi:uncharacterized protein YjbJ (UPF0337 family)